MKKALIIYGIAVALSFIIALISNQGGNGHDFMTLFGLFNIIVAVAGVLTSGISEIAGYKSFSKAVWLASGFLLITGIATCSAFPLRLNAH